MNLPYFGRVQYEKTILGEKLKVRREAKGLVQRQVAAKLKFYTAHISKMESNRKPVCWTHLKMLSILLGINEKELLTLWLADKLHDMVKNEEVGLKAMEAAKEEIKVGLKRKN